MGIQNQHWYNLNANRSYPIDETASGLSDAGQALPFGILADCILRFPTTYGLYAYLSAVSVSPHLVTLCFSASNQHPGQSALVIPDTEPSNPLLATLTVRKPITEAKHYVITPEQPGVAGWVVFGSNLADLTYNGSFSTAAQSALLLRCGRSFVPPGVESVGKAGLAATLSGLINLRAGEDISIVKEAVTLVGFGDIPNALVVRLKASTTYNVFDRYRGPCASRPESGTCRLHPLVSVGTTPFDCDGNLTLELEGVTVTPLQGGGGIVIDFGLGIDQTCARNKDLPDSVGELPNTYSDSCVVVSSSIIDEPEPPAIPQPTGPVDFGACCPLRLDSASVTAGLQMWAVINGRFSWSPLQLRITAEDTAQANIAIPGVNNSCLHFAQISDGTYSDPPKPPVFDGSRMQAKITLQDGDHRNAGFVIYRQPTDITHTDLTKFSMCTVAIDHKTDAVVISLGENPRLDTSKVSVTVPNAIDPYGSIVEYFDTTYRRTTGYYISPRAYAGPFTYGPLGLKLNKQYELCVTLTNDPDIWSYELGGYSQNGVCLKVEVLVRDIVADRYLTPPDWPQVRPDLLPPHYLNCQMVFYVPFCSPDAPWGLYSDRAAALFEDICLTPAPTAVVPLAG